MLPLTSHIFLKALKDSSKRSINSDWKIELPGEFELAGTTVRYVRRGLWEKMSAKGPTKTPLHLMVNTWVILFFVLLSQYKFKCTLHQFDHTDNTQKSTCTACVQSGADWSRNIKMGLLQVHSDLQLRRFSWTFGGTSHEHTTDISAAAGNRVDGSTDTKQ